MTLPDGVTTCLLTFGPITDSFGTVATEASMTVEADRTIVHAASGRTLFKNAVTVESANGSAVQLAVPHVDQTGMRNVQQEPLTGWNYRVILRATFGTASSTQVEVKNFQPLVGQTTVDADTDLPSGGFATPGVISTIATVTSVDGATGAVDLSAVYARRFDVSAPAVEDTNVLFTVADLSGYTRAHVTAFVVITIDGGADMGMIKTEVTVAPDDDGVLVTPAGGFVYTLVGGDSSLLSDFDSAGTIAVTDGVLTFDVPVVSASLGGRTAEKVQVFGTIAGSFLNPS